MQYDVRTITTTERPTAVVAQETNWREWPRVWGKDEVWAFLRDGGAKVDGHNIMLYKDETPNVEVGVQVAGPFAPKGRVVPSVLPAAEVAMTVHRGPYDKLGDAHEAVLKWCAEHGRAVTRERWEIYGDHAENPADLETEVYWRLR